MTHRPIRLTRARVLTSDGLTDDALSIANGMIAEGPAREVDLSGYLVLPGVIDVHGDGFERHMAPRRGAAMDLGHGLRAVEAELATNGITTAMLAQFWSWEGGMRGPAFARTLCAALDRYRARADLRIQLRLEVGCYAEYDAALALVEEHQIGCVVFNDHLPHDALAAGHTPARLTGQALKSGRSPADHLALIQGLSAGVDAARADLAALAAKLIARGVRVGSHDDVTTADRAVARKIGLRIAEFPLSAEVASEAYGAGDAVVMGAPNVVRGGSHKKGGLSALDVVLAGQCDALASDYHYPAPIGAVRALIAKGWPLERAWPLVSSGPARVLGLTDRGALAPGQRADLIIVDPDLTEVHATIASGVFTHAVGDIIDRLMG